MSDCLSDISHTYTFDSNMSEIVLKRENDYVVESWFRSGPVGSASTHTVDSTYAGQAKCSWINHPKS